MEGIRPMYCSDVLWEVFTKVDDFITSSLAPLFAIGMYTKVNIL